MSFPGGWRKRVPLTVQSTNVDAVLTDFPVLVTEDTLPASFFNFVKSDGGDVRFTSDAAGTTILNAELESFDSSGSTCNIWVKVPSIPSAGDVVIYIWYWEPSASQPAASATGGSEGVWNSDFILVSHQADDTTSTILDSTSNNNDGTKIAANEPIEDATGKVANDQDYDGTNDEVSHGDIAAIDGAANLSGSAWIRIDILTADLSIFSKSMAAANDGPLQFFRDNVGGGSGRTNTAKIEVTSGATLAAIEGASGTLNDTTTFHHVAFTFEGGSATGLRLFIDGVEDANSPVSVAAIATLSSTAQSFLTGRMTGAPARFMNGEIDEVRLWSITQTIAWMKAEFNFVNSPSANIVEGVPTTLNVRNLKGNLQGNLTGGFQ